MNERKDDGLHLSLKWTHAIGIGQLVVFVFTAAWFMSNYDHRAATNEERTAVAKALAEQTAKDVTGMKLELGSRVIRIETRVDNVLEALGRINQKLDEKR